MEKFFLNRKNFVILFVFVLLFLGLVFGFGYFFGRLEQIERNKSLLKVIPDVNLGIRQQAE